MKTPKAKLILTVLVLTTLSLYSSAQGQGTFVYDQQSADEGALADGGGFLQSSQPFGQSFTPTMSSVGFIRLWLIGPGTVGDLTIYVNLRQNSINGPILGSTEPVLLPTTFGRNGSDGYANFFFSTAVPVTPGTTYYFQPFLQSGPGGVIVNESAYRYSGGTAIENGAVKTGFDLWSREGIVVPEPSALSLIIGSGVLFYVGCKKIKMRSIS